VVIKLRPDYAQFRIRPGVVQSAEVLLTPPAVRVPVVTFRPRHLAHVEPVDRGNRSLFWIGRVELDVLAVRQNAKSALSTPAV
jgi:hypothetical protein